MIWMCCPTSPSLIFFFTLQFSWHPGICFCSRATFQRCWTLLLPDTNLGHTKRVNNCPNPIILFPRHNMWHISAPFWQFLPNSDEDVIIHYAKFHLKSLMVDKEFQQIPIGHPITSSPPIYYSFNWSQNLAASVKWTLNCFKMRLRVKLLYKTIPGYWK